MSPAAPAKELRPPATTRAAGGVATAIELALPASAVALVEGLLLHAYATGRIGWLALLLAHAAVTALLATWTVLLARSDSDTSMPLLTAIAVAAAGPVGALAALATFVIAGRGREDTKILADWYARIAMAVETDDVSRLCDQVAIGRTAAATGTPPRSFAAAMERGTLDERQAALGVIARNFHPDYLPVLMLALKSPEPVIRVQAAAVATRIRGDLRTLVDRLATNPPAGGTAALSAAAQLDAAVASGLLDESDRIRAGVVALRLRASVAHPTPSGERYVSPVPILDRQAQEALLLGEGRYGEFRIARRIAAVAAAGRFRVRRARRNVTTGPA